MGKKEKEKKEKPLDKMTAKELRELGMSIGGIVGVHGMNKPELIAAIKTERGIVDAPSKKKIFDVRELKAKVQEIKEKKLKALEEGNTKLADSFRRRVSNLKKKTRRAA
ncbi:MAG: transcription termination factor Rho [Syntrophobacteraceae bacterium]|nr:transcription termination factor Rho [Syntrophobacteraceae bacterium]